MLAGAAAVAAPAAAAPRRLQLAGIRDSGQPRLGLAGGRGERPSARGQTRCRRVEHHHAKEMAMTRSKFSTFLATAAVVPFAALAAAGCGGNSSDASASTAPSTTVSGQPGRSTSRAPIWEPSSSTRRAAPSTCSRRTRGRRVSAPARAPPPGRRSGRTACRRSLAGRRPRWSEPPSALTVSRRSPTTATRSTCSRATRSPARPRARARRRSAAAGTPSPRRETRSPDRHRRRLRAAATATRRPKGGLTCGPLSRAGRPSGHGARNRVSSARSCRAVVTVSSPLGVQSFRSSYRG